MDWSIIITACGGQKLTKKRRQYSNDFKFKIALEAVKGVKTVSQIAAEYNLHPTQIGNWKKQLLQQGSTVFTRPNDQQQREQQDREVELYEQIGRLKMELEWLKKKATPFDWPETGAIGNRALLVEPTSAMWVNRAEPVELLLSAGVGKSVKFDPDAPDWRTVSAHTFLRLPENDRILTTSEKISG